MTFKCRICGKPFEAQTIITGLPFTLQPTLCDPCDIRRKEDLDTERKRFRFDLWRSICPTAYQDTDLNHPNLPPPAKQAAVLNWKFQPNGLVVHGKTRRGKTRLVWQLIKRLMVEEGRDCAFTTSIQFARDHASMFCKDATPLNTLKQAEILFIDDLGKEKLTQSAEADLFHLFDYRCSNKLPTLFTSNFTGQTLSPRLSPDTAEAFVARLREFCTPVCL